LVALPIASERALIVDFLHFVKKPVAWPQSEPPQELFQRLLLSDRTVPVAPAARMEAVTHHTLGKQKKDGCQGDFKRLSTRK
jgi:hypothetical protein